MLVYKNLMFPTLKDGTKKIGWTMSELDQMDVHFFNELFSDDLEQAQQNYKPQEKEQYLSDIW
ncbi:hypothetical protein [Oceanobacillus sp. ISL-74]|uniref:hypothetical protein n=2 Tax=unclassified Oceanobacillus TaxID=2630292 RepID=UPI001BEC6369|nr:hypothetical protein [Oceanobacillus sp. ISL-74]